MTHSRAVRASLRFSACSAAFHSACRSTGAAIRQHDFGGKDAALFAPGVIVNQPGARVRQFNASPVRRRRHRGASGAAADGLGAGVVDGQGGLRRFLFALRFRFGFGLAERTDLRSKSKVRPCCSLGLKNATVCFILQAR